MILDSSAVVAVACRELGHERLAAKIELAQARGIGAPTLLEVGIVLETRLGAAGQAVLHRFLAEFEVVVTPFGPVHSRTALDAFRQFGRGRHPAKLNFGDCMAYAIAKLAGEPLLFTGDDFAKTDIQVA